MNLHVHSAHRQRKSLGCEHKKRVEKRWRITRADIRPGVYGPLSRSTGYVTFAVYLFGSLKKTNICFSFIWLIFTLFKLCVINLYQGRGCTD